MNTSYSFFTDVTDIAKELLKQAIRCFRLAEDDITKSDSASLERKDKADFISEYLKVASQGIVSHKEARDIKSFCEVTFFLFSCCVLCTVTSLDDLIYFFQLLIIILFIPVHTVYYYYYYYYYYKDPIMCYIILAI